ncbi:methyltransferase type 12 [Microvirga sp. VF16]|uniref:methyltransferase type 12 n=1 Tax=Microvirga sp. VF16 TaxID=2807101 RepID=UPI00353006A9
MAGQAVYTPRTLDVYDVVVLGLSNTLIWKCPTQRLLDHYNDNVSDRHLDVGVGTGWFLDHCRFPSDQPQITLLDLNPVCLEGAAARILPARDGPFCLHWPKLSAGLSSGCPGAEGSGLRSSQAASCSRRGCVRLNPFVAQGVGRSGSARALMGFYNAKGIFSNQQDSVDDLRRELATWFDEVRVEIIGCAALFAAR